jgi:methylase of polypeptide subunit release factors
MNTINNINSNNGTNDKTNSVFIPNLTSDLLVDSLIRFLELNSIPSKYIEMGCGSGYITFNVCKFLKNTDVTLSDISEKAIEKVNMQLKLKSLKYKAIISNLFSNIDENNFDLIVSDVAAISNELTTITNWYDGVSCDTGKDGLKLITELLVKSKNYLSKSGSIIYPVLSLSDKDKLSILTKKLFSKTDVIVSKDWPYKFTDINHIKLLDYLKKNGFISFKFISGFHVFTTEVWISTL